MKLLLVHNRYRQSGGEDTVFEFEASLLARRGHEVDRVLVSNDDIQSFSEKTRTALSLTWNKAGYALVAGAIERFRPDIVHVHNFFARLSPSVYDAAVEAGIPVVQTLHNFRITCANGLLLRNGAPCELCVTGSPYNAVRFRCYRNSRVGSIAVARMIAAHRRRGTWRKKVARFVALSEFARDRFVAAGLPAERITVKPNGTDDPGARPEGPTTAVLYVGRLSEEKGVRTLLEAARGASVPIRIVGDGPLRAELEATAPKTVAFLGHLSRDAVLAEMARALCLVVPSIWYENFPMTLVEACAVGLPAIVSRLGALPEIVEDGITGLHVA